jgi:hypothetical protein
MSAALKRVGGKALGHWRQMPLRRLYQSYYRDLILLRKGHGPIRNKWIQLGIVDNPVDYLNAIRALQAWREDN